ncbi:MAG: hypothetical protein C4617_00030 [Candidatus Liberibacter europaeus]|uniref:Outer membrane protein beta-barrel domain-containing protein n=1 Tax=Candidatus Liberibacter europaeus TaxID=744859 RepID=A0A2T4VYK2_9HYPH|nr:hypothetical protein [Candidatus Liberibacter europaeus]PTL86860.1 MAG: hypothetical protein C4617_00030 [Candidatus Liberibacter europaeus]
MQKFFLAVGVSSLSLASFYSAQAADAVRRQYANNSRGIVSTASHNAGSRYVPYNNYTDGMYIGLKAQGKSSFLPHVQDATTGSQISAGPGVYAGYNMQVGSMVYGIEAEGSYLFNFSNDSETKPKDDSLSNDTNKPDLKAKQYGPQGTVQVRVGTEIVDSVLGYVSGGLSAAQNNYYVATSPKKGTVPEVTEHNETGLDVGGAFGIGVDITLVDDLIARVGYNVAYYPSVENQQNKLQHNISVGVAMKF